MKYQVIEIKYGGVEDLWVTFDSKQQADAWVENYLVNSQRPRTFVIREC